MPLYYFRFEDGGKTYHDSEGQWLEDDEAARHEAGITLTEIARDALARDALYHEFRIVVTDESGDEVWQTNLEFEAHRPDQ